MDEREFFDEKPDKKPATLNCPHCHQPGEYEIQWLVRTKKKNLPPRADDRDRARHGNEENPSFVSLTDFAPAADAKVVPIGHIEDQPIGSER